MKTAADSCPPAHAEAPGAAPAGLPEAALILLRGTLLRLEAGLKAFTSI